MPPPPYTHLPGELAWGLGGLEGLLLGDEVYTPRAHTSDTVKFGIHLAWNSGVTLMHILMHILMHTMVQQGEVG